jgi:hypothetical protein
MKALHIVQGGIENGDKRLLERIAGTKRKIATWIAPKAAVPGDVVVIFVGGYGFFAMGRVASKARPRRDWPNRYGVALDSISLIKPPISLAAIRRDVRDLTWANYPRSITTPRPDVAARVRDLIDHRLKTGYLDSFDDASYAAEEGLLRETLSYRRSRSRRLRDAALGRSDGTCEACRTRFSGLLDGLGVRVLQVHHRKQMALTDRPKVNRVSDLAVLCANCHSLVHANPRSAMPVETLRRRLSNGRAAE